MEFGDNPLLYIGLTFCVYRMQNIFPGTIVLKKDREKYKITKRKSSEKI